MERITFEGNFCDIAKCTSLFCESGMCSQRKVWERLKYYEDMEEQGRLVVLPFLPNQDVWDYSEFFDGTPYAEYYKLRDSFICVGVSADGKRTFEYDCFTIDPEQIGKTVFLTREEAERALSEKVYEQVQDAVDQHNREAMRKIAAFIEPTEGGAN